ncbi:MAG TPA: 1,2-phenylacetyl-CoA epoxidase subunit PaaD [Actinomycetota bacterium]|nr:1,2-phenylacetyl-CoA epoxidase subunit PaaD [Actinomycetota bacterium]
MSRAPETMAETLELAVWQALAGVRDPEIPPLSIVQLGIVERVVVTEQAIEVDLLPTFAGCPALDVIREDAEAAVRSVAEGRSANVRFVFSPAWTSDRITPEGRAALRSYGLTPPGSGGYRPPLIPLGELTRRHPAEAGATCPFCGSRDTVLESAFGPTLCRTTHFCRSCRNPFEAFKPKGQE